MFNHLPTNSETILAWKWNDLEPYFQELQSRSLIVATVQQWLKDWSAITNVLDEQYARLSVAVSANTADAVAEQAYKTFFDTLYPKVMEADQGLKQKLLESGLEPAGFAIPLRNLRSQADLFRLENLPLQAEESKLRTRYDKIIGAQTIEWEGQERTIAQMTPVYQETDRSRREAAWHKVSARQLADRETINEVWKKLLAIRLQLAANAGRPDYRTYRWQEMLRFDYSPEDARRFQDAIETAVVPAATRIYERRRQRLGVDRLRPWDLDVDPENLPPLRPFSNAAELKSHVSTIFHNVDPQLGENFDRMVSENLLDLENRKNKAPGAYCTSYPVIHRPFIFMNAVGTHDNVQTLLHESGHAFHVFEAAHHTAFDRSAPMEFAEVASMGMELLASPYLTTDQGGFYSPADAARARIEHLEGSILFWPYMAVVDAFQHWVYEHPHAAADPVQCDAAWANLWRRFMPGVDWSGLDNEMATGWHRKLHIFTYPFYYIEYGLAQLGAVQVWANALNDQAGAVTSYRRALSLGGSVTLPQLFQAAGARFALDASALQSAVSLMESTIERLAQMA